MVPIPVIVILSTSSVDPPPARADKSAVSVLPPVMVSVRILVVLSNVKSDIVCSSVLSKYGTKLIGAPPSSKVKVLPARVNCCSSVLAPPRIGVRSTPVPSVMFKVFPVKLRF